jgi:hypothetical protein
LLESHNRCRETSIENPKFPENDILRDDPGVTIGGRSDVTRDEAKAVPEKVVLGLVTPSAAFSDSWSFRIPKTNVEPTKKSLRVSRLPEKCVGPTGGAGVGAQDPSIVEILEHPVFCLI